jgi:ribose transport system permease protein
VIGGTTLEGGRGRLSGTFIAAIILAAVINIITHIGLIVWYQNIIIGIIIISAVFAYIKGIKFGRQV